MGIADLGSGSGAEPGNFTSDDVVGTATIGNVTTYNAALGADATSMSFQLNAFVTFTDRNLTYVYWVQDVALLDTASRAVTFEDNLWNASSDSLAPGAVTGNGTIVGTGPNSYYGAPASCGLPDACTTLANPSTLRMELNTSLSGTGRPQVRFQFDDLGVFTTFDVLTFPWAQRVAGVVGMTVNDHLWSGTACTRCYGDLEWVVGGPGNGYQTTLTGSSSIVLFLDWFNGHNLQAVPSSVDYGISTAEGINGVQAQTVWDPAGVPGVALSVANGSLGPLWTEGQLSILEVSVRTGIPSGDLSLNGTDVPFVGSFVELLVAPGTISGSVTSGSSTFPLGTLTLTQGEALTLEVGALAAVFAPSGLPEGTVWSVTVGSQTLVGTGNLTFGESPGTYPFLVGTVPGYSASPASGNISVNSSGSLVEVQWKPTHAGLLAMLGELLHSWWEVALAIIVILGALGVAWAISSRGPVHPSARRSSLAPLPPRWLTVCPHCGRSVRAGARSCPECGTRLEPPGHGPSPPP